MLNKKLIITLSFVGLMAFVSGNADTSKYGHTLEKSKTAETSSKPLPYNDHPPYNFHGEIDKTDIYAIPLDMSEEEDEAELETLEAGYPPKK